uniref:FGGY carbohydrate kinase domain-containing protein n=1 Tax=Macrostomum lignano TaxID=282301 RepID=A0A1I8IL92_9PLAT
LFQAYISVDVGTSSVRVGIFSDAGDLLGYATEPVEIYRPAPMMFEQSSDGVWAAVCACVRSVLAKTGQKPAEVKAIGFAATCSLVVLDDNRQPLSTCGSHSHHNIIMWLDHRATEEARFINKTGHRLLQHVGGFLSPEMQPPKLLWLKKNRGTDWLKSAGYVLDLCDFLTLRATDCDSRSRCSVVCKWLYDSERDSWDESFWKTIGLSVLLEDGHRRIGSKILEIGDAVGTGLTQRAAAELGGLSPGTVVSTGILDAHAGGLGSILCKAPGLDDLPIHRRMALIAGTSSCHLALSRKKELVPGAWGPYLSVMVPALWLTESGQSASGLLLDYVLRRMGTLDEKSVSYSALDDVIKCLAGMAKEKGLSEIDRLTAEVHVWPDLHGNRSPLADPDLSGMLLGWRMYDSDDEWAVLYLATVQALAYGTRHIVENLTHRIDAIYLAGGLRRNRLYVQAHADVLNVPVVLPACDESILQGVAVSSATAAGQFSTVSQAMDALCGQGEVVMPNPAVREYHDRKYNVFMELMQCQHNVRRIMTARKSANN